MRAPEIKSGTRAGEPVVAWGCWAPSGKGLADVAPTLQHWRLRRGKRAGDNASSSDAEGEEGPRPLLVTGTLEGGDPPKVLVREVLALDRAEEKLAQRLCIRIHTEEATGDRLTALRALLQARPGDCAVTLHVVIPDQSETVIAVNGVRGVRPDDALRRDLDALFGRSVSELAL